MITGTVKFFNTTALERAGIRSLNEGQKVQYELVTDRKTGKQSADNLSLAD
jgi:CspA family cold shock protein